MLACFFPFPAGTFVQPVPVRFLLIPQKWASTRYKRENILLGWRLLQKGGWTFLIPLSVHNSQPQDLVSCPLVNPQSCTFVPNLLAILCKSPISSAQLYTEKLSLATDHKDISFSWGKDIIPKVGRNCLSYKMSYMPLKMSLKFAKSFWSSLNIRIWHINKPLTFSKKFSSQGYNSYLSSFSLVCDSYCHSTYKNRKETVKGKIYSYFVQLKTFFWSCDLKKKSISKADTVLSYSDLTVHNPKWRWLYSMVQTLEMRFFSSLLQLRGSRVEVYEGKVFSSLEPHFRFRFVKLKFLQYRKIFWWSTKMCKKDWCH